MTEERRKVVIQEYFDGWFQLERTELLDRKRNRDIKWSCDKI